MKKVYLVGIGVGDFNYIHPAARRIIGSCGCLIGAKRMLSSLDASDKYECIAPDRIRDYVLSRDDVEDFCVAVSGDPGFYSLATSLRQVLSEAGIQTETVPAIGSLQYLCARAGIPWDEVSLMSAHGRDGYVVPRAMFCRYLFVLTGGGRTPASICEELAMAGLGRLMVIVGENLSYPDERIVTGSAAELSDTVFAGLSSMLVINTDHLDQDTGLRSISDGEFITGKTPVTKREVRCTSVAKLNLKRWYTVYDVGAGTGSVSIEVALRLTEGRIYSIERSPEAVGLIRSNREKFGACNITVVEGTAPEALKGLPKPDAVFIGGSGGSMEAVMQDVLHKNPSVNIVINAITLQSVSEAVSLAEKYGLTEVETVCLNVAKARRVGRYDMMMGQNPVYIISGKGSGTI